MSNSNARYFIWSNGLQNLGDQIVASKTVLPALFNAAGVPAFFTGLLTPIRESGSMLPQAALTPWVTTHRARKRLWMIGSTGQAISGAVIALAAFFIRGAWLGVVVLLALAALSLFRALCSIAGKDVQARTISKGQRGRVTGSAAALGGGATLLAGVILFLLGGSHDFHYGHRFIGRRFYLGHCYVGIFARGRAGAGGGARGHR